MGFLQRILENRRVVEEMAAVSLRHSRDGRVTANLAGVFGLRVAWYVLPGIVMLPLMLGIGMDRWQYDTVVTWAHLVSTSVIVAWYTRAIGDDHRALFTDPVGERAVAGGIVAGIVLAATGASLWGRSLGGGVTIIALRFEPVVDIGVPALFIGAVVLTPLVQEAFFRGVVQTHAESSLSAGEAILVSGTAFGVLYALLFYIGGAVSMAVTMVFLSLQGCLLGYLYHRHGTIVVPAIAHGTVNLYAFVSCL